MFSSKKTICLLTQSHLCRNPRVMKEAFTLAGAGYQVTILTTFISTDYLQEDFCLINTQNISYQAVVDLTDKGQRFWLRLRRRIGTELLKHFGLENHWTLGYAGRKLVKVAARIKADLYIAHQEEGVWAGTELLQQGFRVAFDLEDWHSEDLLPAARLIRPIQLLKKMEAMALHLGAYVITTSVSLANALAKAYHINEPRVVYNAFPLSARVHLDGLSKDRMDFTRPSLFWFSQTIGPGRGLELLFVALRLVTVPVQVHLRGEGSADYLQFLRQLCPPPHTLYVHHLVSPNELLSRISEHDLGLALEDIIPPSRNLTITNKILQYLLAGLPVIASHTEGQEEVAHLASGAVLLFPTRDEESMAKQINFLLADPDELMHARKAALRAAAETFCWEKQESNLLDLVTKALHAPAGHPAN